MKPNNWVSSSQATELLSKQLVTWPLAEKNYKALEAVQVKSFDMGGSLLVSSKKSFHCGNISCGVCFRVGIVKCRGKIG